MAPSPKWREMVRRRLAGLDRRPVGMRGSLKPNETLSPVFTEWMMGWPEGWVTDPAIWSGMKPSEARNAAIKACGNGVVPQQGALAVSELLPHVPAHIRAALGAEAA
ncbi:hypothetical protein QT381_02680 [Galbitalea sp. SE-J8]|uniref:hypothetical protein n=1 Tax=Galbitalea sp. SE-J8 TaxID=3054952 RepID=UPI00259CC790|nr:hypothetical protein [Galbitalea sp. SE-J8]MDM4761909.1 hypothetical protein [Galbitalea sp. SE-J8]